MNDERTVIESRAESSDAQLWGALSHLTLFFNCLIPGGGIAAVILVWLTKGKESPFVESAAKESLNFQINLLIATLVTLGAAFALTLLGGIFAVGVAVTKFAPLIIALSAVIIIATFMYAAIVVTSVITSITLPIIAAIKTNKGTNYRYPLIKRLVK
jgi:uncharacterized Tic20 family protein